ncbi:putative membrane protein [Bacillus glycinifermentans]|uniref:Uncharacterized protein n=1 Tax=Bacillus sonorensis TaxID=119858 RepID=A0ABM6LJ42_9BACI|nr:hypothetical protein S101395_02819 [Bacillus sonorensis]SCA85822.1 putative membrane protein [Bacillus glycinifermentans]
MKKLLIGIFVSATLLAVGYVASQVNNSGYSIAGFTVGA